MPKKHIPHVGELVAHRAIDDERGGAKSAIVEEYVGDEEGGIVVLRGEDGQHEGYDRRELVPLRRAAFFSSGPVLLRPRHLWAMLQRPWGLLSILLAVVLASALVSFSKRYHWSTAVIVGVGVALVLSTVALVIADQYMLNRSKRARS